MRRDVGVAADDDRGVGLRRRRGGGAGGREIAADGASGRDDAAAAEDDVLGAMEVSVAGDAVAGVGFDPGRFGDFGCHCWGRRL